jgi:hypothetical protein
VGSFSQTGGARFGIRHDGSDVKSERQTTPVLWHWLDLDIINGDTAKGIDFAMNFCRVQHKAQILCIKQI